MAERPTFADKPLSVFYHAQEKNVKTIYLDSKYHPVTITEEAYRQIVAIIAANRVCGTCGKPYSNDHPCVSQNLCLNCFQKKYKHKGLTYVGVYTADSKGDVTHLFL